MRAQESVAFTGVAGAGISATTATFNLQGGKYALVQVGDTFTSSNHFDLQLLLPDSTNYVTAIAGVQTGTTGFTTGDLPPGQYKFTLTGTLTAIKIAITRIPTD